MMNNSKMTFDFSYNYPQLARDANFKMRQYKDGPLDWRLMGNLEIERLLKDQSFEQIDNVLPHLSEAPLGSVLDTNILDSGIVKYFAIAQFSIQYLLFCRKFLEETVADLREAHTVSQMEVANLTKSFSEANNEILNLHRKIREIEVIREVVYPCSYCTKNFVSNESLNLHIERKHQHQHQQQQQQTQKHHYHQIHHQIHQEKKAADLTTNNLHQQKEKDNDRNLINAVKLELEIKQLKERLNNAEREIKERSLQTATPNKNESSIKMVTEVEKSVKNVAIQNNLMEIKEKNDKDNDDDNDDDNVDIDDMGTKIINEKRKQQLNELQEKILDFDQWRENQRADNETFVSDINNKLTELTQMVNNLNETRLKVEEDQKLEQQQQQEQQPEKEKAIEKTQKILQTSPSIEQLEKILSEKVEEISKIHNEKLEKVVSDIELSYKEKLLDLERELKIRKKTKTLTDEQQPNETPVMNRKAEVKIVNVKKSRNLQNQQNNTKILGLLRARALPRPRPASSTLNRSNGELTETTNRNQKVIQDKTHENLSTAATTSSSSDSSNHTYVKSVNDLEQKESHIKSTATIGVNNDEKQSKIDDSSDISGSLSEDATSDDSYDVGVTDKVTTIKVIEPKKLSTIEKLSEEAERETNKKLTKKISQMPKPKLFTRKSASKLTNSRLSSLGIKSSEVSISSTTMKRISNILAEKRSKQKQNYPNFNVTRNKIKKFVDKLCSSKLPKDAELMLKSTELLQPPTIVTPKSSTSLRTFTTDTHTEDEAFELRALEASTPLKLNVNVNTDEVTKTLNKEIEKDNRDDFKKRLNRILASPIKIPSRETYSEKRGAPMLSAQNPVPMPRKRVMFNTLSKRVETNVRDGSDHSE